MIPTMAKNRVNKKTLLILLKNLYVLITIPILFLSNVLHTSDVFNKKSKSYHLHDQEEIEGQETKTNQDEEEEEEGLIEISLLREAKEEKLEESVKKGWMSKEEYYEQMTIMEILEEIEAEENLIEVDISIGSIV